MKKDVIKLLTIFISIIILIGFVSAESCEIRQRGDCQTTPWNNIVLGVSYSTNAHAEFPDLGTYSYVLCCDFGEQDTECTGGNEIIKLSSFTNAHAEIPHPLVSNYDVDVCYDGLICRSLPSCDEDYPLEIISLSSSTNAHIGEFDDYSTKICCNRIQCRQGEIAYCSDYYQEECDVDPCGVADISVENNNPAVTCDEGFDCTCEFVAGSCIPRWDAVEESICGDGTIDSDLGETCDGTNLPYTDCSGNVDACTTGTISCYAPGHENECTLNITGCTGCVAGGFCGDNIINNEYESCDNSSLNSRTCEDFGLCSGNLSCYSPESESNCTFDTTGCIPCETTPSTIGKCIYDEVTDDNCDDGFLTYSWQGIWTWDDENTGQTPPCGEDYVEDEGLCYYDPNSASTRCLDGSNTVPCPAQIELPFFGNYSIIIIIALIAIVYFIWNMKDKSKHKKKTKARSKKKRK